VSPFVFGQQESLEGQPSHYKSMQRHKSPSAQVQEAIGEKHSARPPQIERSPDCRDGTGTAHRVGDRADDGEGRSH